MGIKIAINKCFGGFGLSNKAFDMLNKELGDPVDNIDIARDHPALIRVIETLGAEANTAYSKLKIVEIPDGTDWDIDEYGGAEHVFEKHRTWR